jgi:hypothetical protein
VKDIRLARNNGALLHASLLKGALMLQAEVALRKRQRARAQGNTRLADKVSPKLLGADLLLTCG